jgi:hypothetical protein
VMRLPIVNNNIIALCLYRADVISAKFINNVNPGQVHVS